MRSSLTKISALVIYFFFQRVQEERDRQYLGRCLHTIREGRHALPPSARTDWSTRLSVAASVAPIRWNACIPPTHDSRHPTSLDPIRAQYGLRLSLSNPKRSPYRAPFTNTLKSALFLKSGEIKRLYKRVLRGVFGPGWVFCWGEK